MGIFQRLFRRSRSFKERLTLDLLKKRVSAGEHPELEHVDAAEALSLNQLKRQPEWTIVAIVYAYFQTQQERPRMSMADIIEHTELVLARAGEDDPQRFAAIVESARDSVSPDHLKDYAQYRMDMGFQSQMSADRFSESFNSAFQQVLAHGSRHNY